MKTICFTGWVLAKRSDDLVGYTLGVIQAAILVTPVLEPWYLLWLIPLLCLRPSWAEYSSAVSTRLWWCRMKREGRDWNVRSIQGAADPGSTA